MSHFTAATRRHRRSPSFSGPETGARRDANDMSRAFDVPLRPFALLIRHSGDDSSSTSSDLAQLRVKFSKTEGLVAG